MLVQTIKTVFAPHTIAFLCKLSAIIAIVAFATGGFTTGILLNAYIYAARAWVPERSYYERPLFFEYNSTAAIASVSFIRWQKTPDGYIMSPERVEFLKSREQVNIDLHLTLPELPENEALFQLHSFLKSDSNAVLHTLQRPLSLQHRSPIVRVMRQLVLFPFILVGILTESETMTFPLARSFTEQSHSPLATVDVLLTGARPQDPPPRVSHGLLTVNVHMSWIQWGLAFCRVSPLLNVAMLVTATALMLLSSAAAVCSCVLCFQVVAEFWQDSGGSSHRSGPGPSATSVPTASPVSLSDKSALEASGSFVGVRSRGSSDRDASQMHARTLNRSGSAASSGRERGGRVSWDGSEADGGNDWGWRDALNTIAEDQSASDTSQGANNDSQHKDMRCDTQFQYKVKAAVQRGTADYYSRLAAPEGGRAGRGLLGAAFGAPSGMLSPGGARARKGARKVLAGSDASTSYGLGGIGDRLECFFDGEGGREGLQDEPENEIQLAGQKTE